MVMVIMAQKRSNWIKTGPSSIIFHIIQCRNTTNFNTTFILCLAITQRKVIYLGFVSPCIIIHANKSTNQMHQFLRFLLLVVQTGPTTTNDTATTTLRSNGKPVAATAVCKLLMMGKRMPETRWAVVKRRAINLRNVCIWLVDLFQGNLI